MEVITAHLDGLVVGLECFEIGHQVAKLMLRENGAHGRHDRGFGFGDVLDQVDRDLPCFALRRNQSQRFFGSISDASGKDFTVAQLDDCHPESFCDIRVGSDEGAEKIILVDSFSYSAQLGPYLLAFTAGVVAPDTLRSYMVFVNQLPFGRLTADQC